MTETAHPRLTPPPRKLPIVDEETGYYWTGGAKGQLLIARCADCKTYQHPPFQRCFSCQSENMAPDPVSGRGTVKTFTINHQKWLPGLEVPFVFAVIELEEQPELYVTSNVIAPVETVKSGMKVQVFFEQHDDVWLPLFRPRER